ncbi:MAG: metal-dependent transcriptional regulator [Gracilibacteraceae bacterium]|jgi:Mn-dependent DtxR family transcriptional regulator|nr:metal-dependent transcriptional regulator [Gracilibacteraceae bacterium]
MMSLSPSNEHYIKAIDELDPDGNGARISDIAALLGVKKPSASRAVKFLRQKNLVIRRENFAVSLTPAGEAHAALIKEKYSTIKQYLVVTLGVGEEIAAADACAIEHIVSPEIFARMGALLKA